MPDRAFRFAVLALVLCAAVPSHATDIVSGIDLWKTLSGFETKDHLQIPAGFFNTGSDAVDTWLEFKGGTLETKPGTPSLGNADTVLERLDTAHPVTCGASDTVDLRIAALHLVGETPLTVRYGGSSPEGWTVDVYLSDAAQAVGSMTISQNCTDGGTFTSTVIVRPKLVFTRISDQLQRTLDWNVSPSAVPQITFETLVGVWARSGPDGFDLTTAEEGAVVDANHDGDWEDESPLPGSTADFVVGAKASSCSCAEAARAPWHIKNITESSSLIQDASVIEAALLARHSVLPPTHDRMAFPLNQPKDRLAGPAGTAEPVVPRFLSFVPLTMLALAAVAAIPWRRGE